jgi:hypothetical protein
MTTAIHCNFCGGVIRDPATIEYRPPRASAQIALTNLELCTCSPPIVYEHLPIEPTEDEP